MTAVMVRADARHLPLPDESVDLLVTSPPYYALRDYRDGEASLVGQIGAEPSPAEYIASLMECTREWMRVLKPSGSLWINLGDKYAGGGQGGNAGGNLQSPHLNKVVAAGRIVPSGFRAKSLIGLPWRYALGCVDDLGLILRAEVIWSKPNGLPESVTDRVRRSHEHWFHLVRQPRYYSAVDEIREPHVRAWRAGRNGGGRPMVARTDHYNTGLLDSTPHQLGALPGSVWEIATQPLKIPAHLELDHYAAFPPALVRRIILGWSPPGICTACGEGRRPVASVERVDRRPSKHSSYGAGRHGRDTRSLDTIPSAAITGYACACPTPAALTRPALVVDPFAGTGTSALVASVLGRIGISCDLSHDYGRLARWRTTDPAERARALDVPKPPPVTNGQGDLFDGQVIA